MNNTENSFAQMKKNTVDSKNQLKDSKVVRFKNPQGTGARVMFVGNSITLHGIAPHIGWNLMRYGGIVRRKRLCSSSYG